MTKIPTKTAVSPPSAPASSAGETSYRLVAIDDHHDDQGRVYAKVQVIGTNRIFTKRIDELYEKAWIAQFSNEDAAFIGYLYAADLEGKGDLIPAAHQKSMSQKDHVALLGTLYTAFLILSNLTGAKVMSVFGIHIPAVLVFFPLTYIFDDVLTEVYGFKASRRVIWLGFFANLIVSLGSYFTLLLPPSHYWHDQAAFETVFSMSPRILLASTLGYLLGEFTNSIILSKLKIFTSGKYLWLRAISSASVSAAIDSIVFCSLSFYRVLPNDVILQMILVQYGFKLTYETLALPFTYKICNYLKTKDGVDVFDYDTRFNPFSLKT